MSKFIMKVNGTIAGDQVYHKGDVLTDKQLGKYKNFLLANNIAKELQGIEAKGSAASDNVTKVQPSISATNIQNNTKNDTVDSGTHAGEVI